MVISKMRFFLLFFLIFAVFGSPDKAYSSDSSGVKAELVFASSCIESDTSEIKSAVKFAIPAGMHTYWKFAGQTGEPTEIHISANKEVNVSDIKWQIPEIVNNYGFYEIVYSQKAWHFFDIYPSSISAEGLTVDADVTFLQCSNVCEPRSVNLSAHLPVCTKNKVNNHEFADEYKLIASPEKEDDILRAYEQLTSDQPDDATSDNDTKEPVPDSSLENNSLWQIILLSFFGGIILNLMPCVLPVISIKLLGLTKAKDKSIKKESLWYGLGIIFSFLTVWLFIVLIKEGGESLGWGFQLQNPSFVLFMFILLMIIGMIFSGLVVIPPQLTKFIKSEQSAFASGILAVFLASPCVAPFMGTAIAYALTFGGAKAFTVFFFLGFGLAFPFVFLAFFNKWIKYLPKTKRWNVYLQKILAIPLYISSVWLLGVIYFQTGWGGFAIALFTAFMFILAAFFRHRILWLISFAALTAGIMFIHQAEQPKEDAIIGHHIKWNEYSPEALTLAVSSGDAVFIDFTAKWCLTCLVNEKLVLEREKTLDLFELEKVIAMKADFTLKDKSIIKALNEYGGTGVPLYVYYPKASDDGEEVKPVILPQILTFTALRHAVKGEKE